MIRIVRVAGSSMAPTLRPSDLLLTQPVGRAAARRWSTRGARGRVIRGDVVVLRHAGSRMVKRVAAVGGDVVELEAGRLVLSRDAPPGPHVRGAAVRTWTVPAGSVFVTGDNAAASDDSRVWDEPFVALDDVLARVTRRLGSLGALSLRRPAPAAAPGR